MTTLYRLYDAEGALLYIGIAEKWTGRLGQHHHEKPWFAEVANVRLEQFDTRPAALDAERAAIIAEKPRHNTVHNGKTARRAANRQTVQPPARGPIVENPEAIGPIVTYRSLRHDRQFRSSMWLDWEANLDPVSDLYPNGELDAEELFWYWADSLEMTDGWSPRHGRFWVDISWFVETNHTFEGSPLCARSRAYPGDTPDAHFLGHFTWPTDQRGNRIDFNELPVQDKLWRPGRRDKGGFIQEYTGWKPRPHEPALYVPAIATSRVWDLLGRGNHEYAKRARARDRALARPHRPKRGKAKSHEKLSLDTLRDISFRFAVVQNIEDSRDIARAINRQLERELERMRGDDDGEES